MQVIKAPRSQEVFSQNQRLFFRFPDGERPVPDEYAEGFCPPALICGCDYGHIGGFECHPTVELQDQFFAVVEPPVPGEYCIPGNLNRLLFLARLRGGVEGPIYNVHARAGITAFSIGSVGCKHAAGFFDVPCSGWPPAEIPPAELRAHKWSFVLCSPKGDG